MYHKAAAKSIGREVLKLGPVVLAGTRSSVEYLQKNGLTPVQAQRIVNQHGETTMSIIEADPYKALVGGAVNFRYYPPHKIYPSDPHVSPER